MQQFSEEFLSKWEHIINETEITDVPLECIKKVTLKFNNGKRKTINIQLLNAASQSATLSPLANSTSKARKTMAAGRSPRKSSPAITRCRTSILDDAYSGVAPTHRICGQPWARLLLVLGKVTL